MAAKKRSKKKAPSKAGKQAVGEAKKAAAKSVRQAEEAAAQAADQAEEAAERAAARATGQAQEAASAGLAASEEAEEQALAAAVVAAGQSIQEAQALAAQGIAEAQVGFTLTKEMLQNDEPELSIPLIGVSTVAITEGLQAYSNEVALAQSLTASVQERAEAAVRELEEVYQRTLQVHQALVDQVSNPRVR